MNTTQTRELMRVSRRALAMLDPEWSIHRELSSALDAAALVPVRRGRKIPRDCWAGAKPYSVEQWRALNYWPTGVNPDWPKDQKPRFYADKLVKAEPVKDYYAEAREALAMCACGHGAEHHAKDELENLLKCGAAGCVCDHFRYDYKEAEAA